MKIIILEGIATSGKTTVKSKLAKAFTEKGLNYSLVEEDETLMPIRDNKDKETSKNLLKNIIERELKSKKDIIIFDRLFFTHIFRTESALKDFEDIENLVLDNSFLVFLKIDESKIPERIANARIHRGEEWDQYVSKKGNVDQVNNYYINQQRLLLDLLKETKINNEIYDTSSLDFDRIVKDILIHLFEDF